MSGTPVPSLLPSPASFRSDHHSLTPDMLPSLRIRHLNFLFSPLVLDRVRAVSDWSAGLRSSPHFSYAVACLWSILQFSIVVLWKFSHFFISYAVFQYTHHRTQWKVDSFLPGKWGEHYPYYRQRWIALLGTMPIWGFCMVVIMTASFAFGPIRTCLSSWRTRDWQYQRLDLPSDSEQGPSDHSHVEEVKITTPSPHPRGHIASETIWAFLERVMYVAFYISYLSMVFFGIYLTRTYENVDDFQWKGIINEANIHPRPEGYGNGEKIFIAAMFRNNAAVFPYWWRQMIRYINYAGADNVFVSIVESNSEDDTVGMLRDFDLELAAMNVSRRIIIGDQTPKKDRISFLSSLRNRVMDPLVEKGGYDRVLFSNDVFIEAEAMVELMETRGGDWDFVCGLDFGPWGLYDQWVIRDRLGNTLSTNWPYIFEHQGLNAMIREEAVPVFSCWNGVVAFKAEPFLPHNLRTPGRLSTSPLSHPLPPTHPAYPLPANFTPAESAPVQFRPNGKNEPCYTSESFNLPYDFQRQYDMQKIYVSPRVITAYDYDYYVWFKFVLRHWAVKWFIENIENGYNYQATKLVQGNLENLWKWDGGDCHPFW